MPKVFITRQLSTDSPLRPWAAANGHELIGRSFLKFEAVSFTPPQRADWWFFYSSRAVEFGLRAWPGVVGSTPRLAAMGPGTAATLREMAGRVDFIGRGSPEEVATAFGGLAAGERVFFPRARQSRLSVQRLLADQLLVLDAICYDNVAVPVGAPIIAEVMIFTSPLNVAAYLDHQPLGPATRVLAIGPSTASALAARGVRCEVATTPTEAGLLALLAGDE